MRADVCSVFSADFCCPGVDSEAAGRVWPGISIVSLTLQGVSKSPAHFARHEWRIVYFLNTLVAARHTALSLWPTLGDKFAKLIFMREWHRTLFGFLF